MAHQLAGDEGVAALGPSAQEAPPGTDTINRVIALVEGPVLLLFDELLNVFNRHRELAEPMHAFLHNIVRGFIGTAHRAAVFSLPRSEVEMTDWDQHWQGKIIKVVGAVAKPLLVTDEGEISEVIRRRRRASARLARGGMSPRLMPTGASSAAPSFPRNGPPSTPRPRRRRPASFSSRGSKRAFRSIRPRFRYSSGNGGRCRSSSRPAARWPCSPSGFPWRKPMPIAGPTSRRC